MRYRLTPVLTLAVLFILLAPVYWLGVELREPGGEPGPGGAYLFHYVYPVYEHAFTRLAHGELPLWNDRQLCGAPLLADFRAGIFDPLRLPFVFLPAGRALAVTAFVCLAGMGFFMALAARSAGAGYLGSLLAGLLYAFCGAAAAAASQPATASAMLWGAFGLWAVRVFAGSGRPALCLLAALAWAALLLSGSLVLAIPLMALQLVYALWLCWDRERLFGLRVSGVLATFTAAALAGAVAAIQWLPTLAYAQTLADPVGWLFAWEAPARGWASLREGALQFLAAPRASTEFAPSPGLPILYFGALPLVLLPAALFHRRRRELVFLFPVLAVLLTLSLFLGLRGATALAAGLAVSAAQCLALLTAFGATRLMETRHRGQPVSVMLPSLLSALPGFALIYLANGRTRGALIVAVVLIMAISVIRARWFIALGGCALGALLFVDLASALSHAAPHPFHAAPGVYERHIAALDQAARRASTGRVVLAGGGWDPALSPNLGLLEGFNAAGGAFLPLTSGQDAWWTRLASGEGESAARPRMVRPALRAAQPRLLEAMAVRSLVAPDEGEWQEDAWRSGGVRLRAVGSYDGARVFALDGALPRAFWIDAWDIVDGPGEAADWVAGDNTDLSARCCVDRASARLLGPVPDPSLGFLRPLSIEAESPEKLRLDFEAPGPGIAVVNDTLAPGWRAELDGRPVPLLRVNGLFRGVAVAEGPHALVMRYEAPGFRTGRGVTFAALGVTALAGAFSLLSGVLRRTRSRPA